MKHIRVFSKPKTLSATCFVGIMFEKKLLQVGWFGFGCGFFLFERIKYLELVELGAVLQTECSKEKANLKKRYEILFSRVLNFQEKPVYKMNSALI